MIDYTLVVITGEILFFTFMMGMAVYILKHT